MMKNDLFFDFQVNKEQYTISVKREFSASVQAVWKAWTQPEILDQWWAPTDWESRTKSMEFREGGQRLYVMLGPENYEHWGITTYKDIELYQRFSGRDYFSDKEGNIDPDYPQSHYWIVFNNKDQNTLIEHVTTYSSLEQLEASIKYGFKEGMIMAFEALDRTLTN